MTVMYMYLHVITPTEKISSVSDVITIIKVSFALLRLQKEEKENIIL